MSTVTNIQLLFLQFYRHLPPSFCVVDLLWFTFIMVGEAAAALARLRWKNGVKTMVALLDFCVFASTQTNIRLFTFKESTSSTLSTAGFRQDPTCRWAMVSWDVLALSFQIRKETLWVERLQLIWNMEKRHLDKLKQFFPIFFLQPLQESHQRKF